MGIMTQDSPDAPRRSRFPWAPPALASGLLAAAVVVAVTAIRRVHPFGPNPRGLNDLSNQFVPFHAYLWDLLHGRAEASIAWNVGLGIPFLPDYAAYLASPFAPLVALFPRAEIETAVFVVTVLKIAVAAMVMTAYLLAVRRDGSRVVAALLGAAYATCGWALDDAIYVTMWLDSLIALPAIALAMEHLRLRGRFVLATLVVAVFWWANSYTALMATVGAGTLVLARVVSDSPSWRRGILDLLRSSASVVLGVALTSTILVPFLSAMSRAQASPERPFSTYPWDDVLARALPLTGGVGRSPGLYVGTVVLVLALSLPFLAVPLRRRMTYAVGAVLVMLSMQWPPTMFVWHAFDLPNGSQFRAAFAMAAWVVVCAWVATEGVSRRPLGLLGGAGLVAALAWWAGTTTWTSEHTQVVAWLGAALAAGLALTLFAVRGSGRAPRVGLVGVSLLLAVGLLVEGTWTGVALDAARAERFVTHPDAGPIMPEVAESLASRPGLPDARMSGPQEFGRNEAYLLGIPGGDYYSSTISAAHSDGVRGLGVTWTSNGLSVRIGEDSGIRTLLGIETALDDSGAVAWTGTAAPIARRIPAPPTGADAASVFEARNRLAGVALYAVPAVSARSGADGSATALPLTLAAGEDATLQVTCSPGSTLTLDAPLFTGTVSDGVREETYAESWDVPAPRELGRSIGAPVVLRVVASADSALPAHPIGCLDPALLAQVATEPAPSVELTGSTIEVAWPESSAQTAVLSVPAYEGWQCSAGDVEADITPVQGLIAVPLEGARTLSCSYRQPGLLPGLGLSLLAALVLTGIGVLAARRRRGSPRLG
jgi:hypothetical protein